MYSYFSTSSPAKGRCPKGGGVLNSKKKTTPLIPSLAGGED